MIEFDSVEPAFLNSEKLPNLPDGWKATIDTAELPDGRRKKGIRLHRSHSVHIIAITDASNIVLLREFRPFLGTYIWMLPSGKADKEADLVEAAHRELREETGYEAKALTPFCRFFSTDSLSIRNYVFIGKQLQRNPLPQDETELIEKHELSLEEAIEKILSSDPIHSVSAAALLRFKHDHPSSMLG